MFGKTKDKIKYPLIWGKKDKKMIVGVYTKGMEKSELQKLLKKGFEVK